jgi:hypothetical protein
MCTGHLTKGQTTAYQGGGIHCCAYERLSFLFKSLEWKNWAEEITSEKEMHREEQGGKRE